MIALPPLRKRAPCSLYTLRAGHHGDVSRLELSAQSAVIDQLFFSAWKSSILKI